MTLAVCQVFMGLPNDRQFLALARYRLGHLFPTLIDQSGYNRRLRALAPQIARAINYLAFTSPSFCDNLAATRLDPGALRPVARDDPPLGVRRLRELRLLPLAQPLLLGLPALPLLRPDGIPIGFELAPANAPEREAAKEMLERVPLAGPVVIADKGFAGADFEGWMANRGAHLLRPDRKDEPYRHDSLGQVRQMDRIGVLDLQGPTRA